jgi:hypothetical protein
VERFFKIRKGDISELSTEERRKLAESIQIIAIGRKECPTICVYDDGEGQHPTDFEDTFLSSSTKGNKIKIKFVQGKFNMGGTAVIPFCGERKYQLILSRRHPQLLAGKEDLYGFTLIRFHPAEGVDQYKSSWYEYCVNTNKQVFTVRRDSIDAGLYNRQFVSGTYVKMFNYDLQRASDITLHFWRDLNRLMYAPALPILLYETRYAPRTEVGRATPRTPTKLMLGNRMRVLIDDRDKKESTFQMKVKTNGESFPGEVTVFKSSVDRTEFVDKMAVVFTVNGQVHDSLGNYFITNTVKFPYLSGSVLVQIDCSHIQTYTRDLLFASSRDRRRDSELARSLDDNIAKELRDNDFLRQLNERRRDEKIFQNPKDDDFMKRVMGKLLSKNDEIAKVLGLKGDIRHGLRKLTKPDKHLRDKNFIGKRFPSYVKLKNVAAGNIKMMPQNGECKLQLETDVEDEYLLRPNDPGELKIKFLASAIREGDKPIKPGPHDEEPFDVNVVGPNQGEIKIRVKSKNEMPVGHEVPISITLTSPSGDHVLTAIVKLMKPNPEESEHEVDSKDSYSLPQLIEVYREKKEGLQCRTWEEYQWTEDDICCILPSSDKDHLVDAVAVNMDARVIHDHMRQKKITGTNVEHLKRLFKVAVYLLALIIYLSVSERAEIEDREGIVAFLMRGVGKVILPIVINDEILKEIEKED